MSSSSSSSAAPKYMTLQGSQLALKELLTQIQAVIDAGLSQLKLAGELKFYSDTSHDYAGLIRLNSTDNTLQFSTDGGSTWGTISAVDYNWSSSKAYNVGDSVMYQGDWYKCTKASVNNNPATSGNWELLTVGSATRHVFNNEQFKEALEATDSTIEIVLHGNITGNVTATVTADTVTIYSDETVEVENGPISITTGNGANVYWHCKGSKLHSMTVTATNGYLYLERFVVPNNEYPLVLTGNVRYQYAAGSVSGGTQHMWCDPTLDDRYAPKNLGSLSSAAFSDDMLFYTQRGSETPKKLAAGTILNQFAGNAAKYFKINQQDILANKPASAVEGYVFYAVDTGDLYVMGASSWSSPIPFRGPSGASGAPGASGTPGYAPAVTIAQGSSDTSVTITDATHQSPGQTFVVPNGRDGATPVFGVGTVGSLAPGDTPQVSLGSAGSSYTFNFKFPGATQPDWNEDDSTAPDYILNKPSIPSVNDGVLTFMQNSSVLGSFTANQAGSTTIEIPEGGGVSQVQADWNQSDSSAVDYIKNKPTIPVVNDATITLTQAGVLKGTFTLNQSSNASINFELASGSMVQEQADWNQTNSSSVDYIKNKPSIPVVNDATITLTQAGVLKGTFTLNQSSNASINFELASGSMVQEQADWNQSDSSAVDYIKNKPSIPSIPSIPSVYDGTLLIKQGSSSLGVFTANASSSVTVDIPEFPSVPAASEFVKSSEIGAANGVAGLDASGKVPTGQLNYAGGNASPAGVIKLFSNGHYGLKRLDMYDTGLVGVAAAPTSGIDSRLTQLTDTNNTGNFRAIVPNNLNYAVTAALTDASRISLTSSQQSVAQDVLGVNNAKLTIYQGSSSLGEFTANASSDVSISLAESGGGLPSGYSEEPFSFYLPDGTVIVKSFLTKFISSSSVSPSSSSSSAGPEPSSSSSSESSASSESSSSSSALSYYYAVGNCPTASYNGAYWLYSGTHGSDAIYTNGTAYLMKHQTYGSWGIDSDLSKRTSMDQSPNTWCDYVSQLAGPPPAGYPDTSAPYGSSTYVGSLDAASFTAGSSTKLLVLSSGTLLGGNYTWDNGLDGYKNDSDSDYQVYESSGTWYIMNIDVNEGYSNASLIGADTTWASTAGAVSQVFTVAWRSV